MYEPKVSICMATWNRAHIIGKSIQSAINQDYDNWELVISDDGSTDNTGEVVKKYVKRDKRIKYIPHEKTVYYTDNRNIAIDNSDGELLAFCDDDNIMHPRFLKELVKPHKVDDVVLTYCGRKDYRDIDLETLDIDKIDDIPPTVLPAYVEYIGPESLSGHIDVGDMVIKRSVFNDEFTGFRSGEVEKDYPSYCSDAKLIDDIEKHNPNGKFVLVRQRLSYYILDHGSTQMTLRKIEGREKGELVDEEKWNY